MSAYGGKFTPEGKIKHDICEYLSTQRKRIPLFWLNTSTGIFDATRKIYRKNNSKFALNGTSDILGILNDGRLLAIEVKALNGVLSPLQSVFLDQINHNKGLAFVARSVDDVITGLQSVG